MRILFGIILCFACICSSQAQFDGDECTLAHNQEMGICTKSRECPEVVALYRQGLKYTTCSYIGGQHIVCCPIASGSKIPNNQATNPQTPSSFQATQNHRPQQAVKPSPAPSTGGRISVQKCAEYKTKVTRVTGFAALVLNPKVHQISAETCDFSVGLIVGGVKTTIGEFPHMAALALRESQSVKFFCGGSLISEKFVLTAAHCKAYDSNQSPFVRLGVVDIKNQSSGPKAVDIPIAEFIKHNQYRRRTKQNDIALLRLSRPVEFSNYIRPACLWQTNHIPKSIATASGWGHTEWSGNPSDGLLKVNLNILDGSVCQKAFEDDSYFVFTGNQLCAGILKGGHDTCQGDSGGPLQIILPDNKCIYSIIGITSFGAGCGHKNAPSVYTRVSAYVDWIESIVWS